MYGYGGGYGPGFGPMGGWGGFGGGLPFHGIFGLLLVALVIAALVWFVRAMLRPPHRHDHDRHDHGPRPERRSAGLDLLDERYARGEINREEYLEKRADVLG